jgi:hypothetical protein
VVRRILKMISRRILRVVLDNPLPPTERAKREVKYCARYRAGGRLAWDTVQTRKYVHSDTRGVGLRSAVTRLVVLAAAHIPARRVLIELRGGCTDVSQWEIYVQKWTEGGLTNDSLTTGKCRMWLDKCSGYAGSPLSMEHTIGPL